MDKTFDLSETLPAVSGRMDLNRALPQSGINPVKHAAADGLKQLLHGRLLEALYYLFPKGKVAHGKFLVGNIHGHAGESLSVELSGDKVGLWHDFATGEGGDIFSLWGVAHGWDSRLDFPEILRSAQEWLGMDSLTQKDRGKEKGRQPEGLGTPTGKWAYQNVDGDTLAWAYRFDTFKGKEFRYQDARTGQWKIPCPRPLYNQPGMARSGTVVLVEGEKCAAALVTMGICATTAMNGANAPVDKTDWSPLKGKHVLIWPDNDIPGRTYADRVASKLRGIGVLSVSLMDIHQGKAEKWDAVDAIAEGLDIPAFMESCARKVEAGVHEGVTEEWPDPLPVKSELLPVKPFEFSLMPYPLCAFVRDASVRMQCPPDYIAVSMVFMFGGLIGTACGVKPKRLDDWVVVPNLWGGIVGNPSTLKTPAITEAFAPLYKIEKDAMEEYQEKSREWESRDKVSKLREESVKSDIKNQMKNRMFSDEEALKLYASQVREIPKPSCRRYKTNDGTIEKVHELLSQNPRGLIQYRDELVGVMAGWEKEGHGADRAFYLEAWNGYGSFTVDRIGRGTIHAENICIAIFGSAQPDKILSYIHKSLHALDNDGLLQRFQLLVYPDPLKEWEYVDRIPEQGAKAAFHNLAFQIARTDFFEGIPDIQEVRGKKCFSFDDGAQEAFIDWLTGFEKKLKGFDEPIIIQHLAKYRKLMPALALIFHVVAIADKDRKTGKISKEATNRAISWCEYLEFHARRIYGMALDISIQAASVLSKQIKRGELGQKFSLRDVYRKQWSFLKDRDSAEAACEELVKNHWLREVSSTPAPGQKIKTEYVVNPKIDTEKKESK
jgi:hypothetical protein